MQEKSENYNVVKFKCEFIQNLTLLCRGVCVVLKTLKEEVRYDNITFFAQCFLHTTILTLDL